MSARSRHGESPHDLAQRPDSGFTACSPPVASSRAPPLGLAELSFGYDPSRASFSLDWARVVEPDGTVVGAEPVHVQVLDQPVSRNAPVYTEVKRVRASLGDVTEGRIVDWRYT